MIAKKCRAQNIASDRRELLLVLLDARQLYLAFALNRGFRETRVQQDVGEKFDPEMKIGLGDVDGDAQTVVPGIASYAAADGLDAVGDLLRCARCRSLEQCLCHQAGDAVRGGRLCEKSTAKYCRD